MDALLRDKSGHDIDPEQWGAYIHDRNYPQIGDSAIAGMRISTVWLGINHNHTGNGPPLIFETMFFGGPLDCFTFDRWATEEDAQRGHVVAVNMLHDYDFLRGLEVLIRLKFTGRARHGWVKWCRDWRRHVVPGKTHAQDR